MISKFPRPRNFLGLIFNWYLLLDCHATYVARNDNAFWADCHCERSEAIQNIIENGKIFMYNIRCTGVLPVLGI